jgi:hypothetical protein
MSRYMQIDIRIIPFYEGRFEKRFPRIADLLRQTSHKDLVEKEVSLYELTDYLETIAESPDTPSSIKEKLGPYVLKIMPLREVAREHLLARRLNELDRVLYLIEDAYEDLEDVL